MSARDDILAGVRRALASAPAPSPVPRGYRAAAGPDDAVAVFAERVAEYRAEVTRTTADEVERTIAAVLPEGSRVVVPADLPYAVPGAEPDTGQSADQLDGFHAVVTTATVGIAATGTIVLAHGPGEGRRALSLVPDVHVCVIREDHVVPGVGDAVALLDPATPTTWISGPSATSDIELQRVEGVHGPRTLHVVLVAASVDI